LNALLAPILRVLFHASGNIFWKRRKTMSEKSSTLRSGFENAASKASETVQHAVSTAGDKAQQLASSAGDKASELASSAGQKVEDATAALGEKVKSMAGTLRDRGPHEGMLGSASGAVADTLDHAGRYLQEEGLGGMAEDLTELIRRNPIPALLIGVGIGFLLAKAIRS
jgi:hypothetical protein